MSSLNDTDFNMEKLAVFIISVLCSTYMCLASDTLYLQSEDFSVIKDDYIQLFIQIKSPNAIKIIDTTANLTICFKVGKKNYLAKGTYWYDSSTPSGCNCIFLKTQQGNTAVMNNDTLLLVKTPPDKKKLKAWKQVYLKYKPATYVQLGKRYQDHCFKFCSDGTFVEYQWQRNYQDVPCEKGWVISSGNYEIKPRYYILNSNQNYLGYIQDTILPTIVQSAHTPQDSVFITINSPYNQLFSAEDTCTTCKYRHQRIFSYDYIIKCGDDECNKEYEKTFNSKFIADTTGMVRAYKPQNIHLKSVSVKIYWKSDHKDTIIIRTYPGRILQYENKDYMENDLTFSIPSLNYTFLSKINYTNYKLRRKSRKILVWQDETFRKILSCP